MKSLRSLPLWLLLAAVAVVAAGCNKSAAAASGQLLDAKGADPAWLAKEIAVYPLTTCTVSGDKLGGSMGPALDYIYRVPGQPDRLIRFCCSDCPPDFRKDPAKYLKMVDDAIAAKKAGK